MVSVEDRLGLESGWGFLLPFFCHADIFVAKLFSVAMYASKTKYKARPRHLYFYRVEFPQIHLELGWGWYEIRSLLNLLYRCSMCTRCPCVLV